VVALMKEVNSVSVRSGGRAWESRKAQIQLTQASLARAFGECSSSGLLLLGSAEEKRTEMNQAGVA